MSSTIMLQDTASLGRFRHTVKSLYSDPCVQTLPKHLFPAQMANSNTSFLLHSADLKLPGCICLLLECQTLNSLHQEAVSLVRNPDRPASLPARHGDGCTILSLP